MIELVAHELIEHGNLKKWIVFTNEDALKNYEIVFGNQGVVNLNKVINIYQSNFYEIKRYFQFVGIIAYNHSLRMVTMNLFESEEMDSFLDGFLLLQNENWKNEDLKKIGEITQQIVNDKSKQLASIRLNKIL